MTVVVGSSPRCVERCGRTDGKILEKWREKRVDPFPSFDPSPIRRGSRPRSSFFSRISRWHAMAPDVQRRETGFVLCSHVESFTMGKLERARGNILTGNCRGITKRNSVERTFFFFFFFVHLFHSINPFVL